MHVAPLQPDTQMHSQAVPLNWRYKPPGAVQVGGLKYTGGGLGGGGLGEGGLGCGGFGEGGGLGGAGDGGEGGGFGRGGGGDDEGDSALTKLATRLERLEIWTCVLA